MGQLEDMHQQIERVHKSSRTFFRFMLPMHEWCRFNLGWYYRWHLKSYFMHIHWATLIISFVVAVGSVGYVLVPTGPQPQAAAGINKQLPFQGRLANANGTVVNTGTYDIVFNLYTVSSGGVASWTESRTGGNAVTVTNGIFNVMLGSLTSLGSIDFNSDAWYLGITVGADAEMTPRLRLGAAPYALNAETVGGRLEAALALLAGRSSGQILAGGTAASETLTLQSTSNATKGKIQFGTSVYDEATNRLGLGTNAPTNALSFTGQFDQKIWMERQNNPNTAGNGLILQAGSATSGATDKNGGRLALHAGLSTGTGTSLIDLETARGYGSGTVDNPVNIRLRIGDVYTTLAPHGGLPGETLQLRFAELYENGTPNNIDGVNYIGFKAPDVITNNVIWTLPSSDGTNGQVLATNGSGALSWATSSGGTVDNSIATGRLTLTSGTPVTTANVTSATSMYYSPYKGNRIALYDGSAWNVRTFSELSKALGTLSNDTNYDVFVYDNAGTPTIDTLVAWTNDTTRATALVLQDGISVKSGATTRRYVGTFRTTTTTTTEDSLAKRFVWNVNNRIARAMQVVETTYNWFYTNPNMRQANGSAANQLDFVIGLSEEAVEAQTSAHANHSNSFATGGVYTAIGLDGVAVPADSAVGSAAAANIYGTSQSLTSHYKGYPGVGRHRLVWLEASEASSGGTQWWGNGSNEGEQPATSGIRGIIHN